MGWIATPSGQRVQYPDTDPATIKIEDIAHKLSMHPRWAGDTIEPFSVAQHCLNCSALASEENQLAALLHDASEAYIGDLAKPFKEVCGDYQRMESVFLRAIGERFGVELHPLPKEVKEIDARMLKTEHTLFLPEPHQRAAEGDPYLKELEPYAREDLTCPGWMGWRLVRSLYLERLCALTGETYNEALLP